MLSDTTDAPGQPPAKPQLAASAAPPPPAREDNTVTNPPNMTNAALEYEREFARRGGDVRALRKEAAESKTEGKAYEGLAAFRLWQLKAKEGIPTNQPKSAGPTIRRDPVIFIRQRRSGPGAVFELILEDIANRTDFPAALLQIVGLARGCSERSARGFVFVVLRQRKRGRSPQQTCQQGTIRDRAAARST